MLMLYRCSMTSSNDVYNNLFTTRYVLCFTQKVEPENMSVNERLLFWVNLFNTITGMQQ